MNNEFIAHVRKNGDKQSLRDHLDEVGKLSAHLAKKIGVGEAGNLIGLLHDFGKYSEGFQRYISSATGLVNPDEDEFVDFRGLKGKIDHSTAGSQLIWQKCQQ
ncbi:MAG: CRISPR-associated endonuclease Cas3'' [Gammaproteobacteria bacterium]|nr:CRISPR-associated endonuclease Cas3'' [Gammaproteobacteria bacterium]